MTTYSAVVVSQSNVIASEAEQARSEAEMEQSILKAPADLCSLRVAKSKAKGGLTDAGRLYRCGIRIATT